MTDELQPIPADQARAILEAAIRERLGDDWEDDEDGWVRVTGHDYMARLTKGRTNLDFYVDLLGNVTVEEKPISLPQDSGRIIAWMFLLLSLGIAYLVARIAGLV
jgi:predicted chitinase